MTRAPLCLPLCAVLLNACTTPPHRSEFSGGYPVHDCPDSLEGQVQLRAEVHPAHLRAADFHHNSIATTDPVARRLRVSIVPAGLHPEDRVVWSALSVASYGGTFLGWDRLQTDERSELAVAELSPGQLKITRIAKGKVTLAGMQSIDLLLTPGGVPVDDTVVRIPDLWRDDGTPTSGADITPQLVPVRHPPGLDIVEASLQLDFVVRVGKTGDEWSCSAETRTTLVDQDSLRQPFWDIGLASANSARREWLALFAPALGSVRLVFDSPASAHAFAEWLRATRSTQLGSYELAVFRQTDRVAGRPFGSLAAEAMRTLRPLNPDDIRALSVGPVGEP